MEIKTLDADSFFDIIMRLIDKHQIGAVEAVCHYCEMSGIEIETAAQLIAKCSKFRTMVKTDGESINMLPKSSKLPV
jgi:hypothetical protein